MSVPASALKSLIRDWVSRQGAFAITRLFQARAVVFATNGWRRRGLAFAAGAFSNLALAPFFFWPILFLTLPVLIWLIDSACSVGPRKPEVSTQLNTLKAIRSAAHDGWWFGFGYFLFGLFWIGEAFLVEAHIFGWLLPFAVTIMPAGLALFYALASSAACVYWTNSFARVLILSIAFGCAEWLRGHIFTGFPWNVLGYALTYPLSFMQVAGLVGIYSLTLWVIVICSSPLVLLTDDNKKGRSVSAGILLICFLPLVLIFSYGTWRLSAPPSGMVNGVALRIVQPSIPQKDKWAGPKQSEVFQQHLALSRRNPDGRVDDLAGITHIIWPEAAMPFGPLSTPAALTAIGEMLPPGKHLLAGALRRQTRDDNDSPLQRPKVYNSLMAFDGEGGLVALYDKTHLVPFGEYLPFQNMLEAIGLQQLTRIRGGFSVGKSPRPLMHVSGLPAIGPLICYEAIFPAAAIQSSPRPGVLINVTNDGWFGNTTGPQQHFHQTRVRAIEEGIPVLRVANNGISATIDPYGRIVGILGLNETGVLDTGLPKSIAMPMYGRFGDAIFLVNALVFGFFWLALRAGRKRKN